jgi:hypothetical protein
MCTQAFSGVPAARAWMLETGALFMRTETELILTSRRVVSGRLLESGFTFQYPDWPRAAQDLCRRHRSSVSVRSLEPPNRSAYSKGVHSTISPGRS